MSTKTITVNPELFRMTKKKRPSSSSSSPTIRPRSTVDKNKTVRRNQVLKFIRGEQEKLQRKLLDGDVNLRAVEEEPAADFQDSLDYLMNLAQEETGKQQKQHGWSSSSSQTLKHRPTMLPSAFQTTTPPPIDFQNENVSLVMPDDLLMQPMNLVRPPMPKWGCLKGGQLPSYRQYTQRNRTTGGSSSQQQQQPAAARLPYTTGVYHPQSVAATLGSHSGGNVVSEASPVDNFYMLDGGAAERHSEIRQTMAAAERAKPRALQRQQRTVRRTYNVGKNKSQVSVLVSNKTIRNRVTAKTHEIRQKPLEEVKRFLINKGFVRVGTSAPNDVLRKMYESAQLICGEIQNHNPENLLFNFMAGSK